jgi:hypothetical protein
LAKHFPILPLVVQRQILLLLLNSGNLHLQPADYYLLPVSLQQSNNQFS